MSEYILPHVDGYLKLGQDYDCSDIHLAVNSRPTWRRFGQLLPIWEEAPNLTPQDTEVLARGFLEDPEWNRLQQRGDVDFAYANDFGRYRASVVKQRLGYDICFRIINAGAHHGGNRAADGIRGAPHPLHQRSHFSHGLRRFR